MSESKVIIKKKSGKKKAVAVTLVIVLAAGGAGGAFYYQKNTAMKMPEEMKQAQSATAEIGTISDTITGTGNLTLADAQSQTVPSGIEIEEVLVESGDTVTKGETIATVNKASVLKALKETQEEIQALDEKISVCQDEDDEETLEASVSGRVKLIYAQTGDDTADVMLENGALMILSLDGKMAVDIKTAGIKEGDSVTVTLSSGTQVTGTAAKVSGSTVTVTLTDNGTIYDDTVTVTDDEGKELGTGNLYIHEPLEITGTAGTVTSVDVSENESVTSGTDLLTLENGESDTEYQELLAQRQAYSATLKKLLQLSKNQNITAEISGTVQNVNVSAGSSQTGSSGDSTGSSSAGSSSGAAVSKVSAKNTGTSVTLSRLSYRTSTSAPYGSEVKLVRTSAETFADFAETETEYPAVQTTDAESETGVDTDTEASDDTGENAPEDHTGGDNAENQEPVRLSFRIETEGQSTADTLVIGTPAVGNVPAGELAASDGSYTGVISWNPADSAFAAGTVYQAQVTLCAAAGYSFDSESIDGIQTGTVSGVSASEDGSTLTFTITYPQTAAEQTKPDQGKEDDGNSGDFIDPSDTGTDSDSGSGSENGQNNGNTDNNNNNNGNNSNENGGSAGDTGNSSGGQSGMSGNTGVSGGTGSTDGVSSESSTAQSTESDSGISSSEYSTDVEAFTISSDENMILAVSVDELDINSVELGQEATVTLDAIEDEEFTGEVTAIGDAASVSGGVAKYTVSLSISKDDRMKQGMNASATITIDNRENVVMIPMNALQEEGSRVFVYTKQDEDGTLSGEQEVTTGLSDGTTVEITEGLSEGDTVYYNKTGNTKDSSSDQGGFGGGDGGPGGNGGPGGDMPSGGGNGGDPGNMPNM